jgi:hypothetical protein
MISTQPASPESASVDALMRDIRQDVFTRMLAPAGGILWLIVAIAFWYKGRDSFPLLLAGLGAVLAAVVGSRLVKRHYTLAAMILLGAFVLTSEYGLRPIAPLMAQYFYPVISVLAVTLLGPLGGRTCLPGT